MKRILLLSLMTLGLSSYSCITYAAVDKQELAQEVAHCYVGHERAQTPLYKSGEAEQLKDIIGDLVGTGDINKMVQIANRIQRNRSTGTPGVYAPNKSPEKVMKKYCTSLDEKLAAALK